MSSIMNENASDDETSSLDGGVCLPDEISMQRGHEDLAVWIDKSGECDNNLVADLYSQLSGREANIQDYRYQDFTQSPLVGNLKESLFQWYLDLYSQFTLGKAAIDASSFHLSHNDLETDVSQQMIRFKMTVSFTPSSGAQTGGSDHSHAQHFFGHFTGRGMVRAGDESSIKAKSNEEHKLGGDAQWTWSYSAGLGTTQSPIMQPEVPHNE